MSSLMLEGWEAMGGGRVVNSNEKKFEVSLLIEYILYFLLSCLPPTPTPPTL